MRLLDHQPAGSLYRPVEPDAPGINRLKVRASHFGEGDPLSESKGSLPEDDRPREVMAHVKVNRVNSSGVVVPGDFAFWLCS